MSVFTIFTYILVLTNCLNSIANNIIDRRAGLEKEKYSSFKIKNQKKKKIPNANKHNLAYPNLCKKINIVHHI